MQMTSDVTEGAMILRVHGEKEAWLENYQTLLTYTDEAVRVEGKHTGVLITGERLRIEYYSSTDMKIVGTILKIEFV